MAEPLTCRVCGGGLTAVVGFVKGEVQNFTPGRLTCTRCGMPHRAEHGEDGMARAKAQERQFDTVGTRSELLEKLRRLDERLVETEGMKASMSKDYGEQIKDIKAERKAVMQALKDAPEAAAPEAVKQ